MAGTPHVIERHKGRKPKLMRPTNDKRWSAEAEAVFLEALGASCNVRWSAAQAGFTTSVVYRQRIRRPDFAERWEEALQQGYARLEMALVRSAADTMEGIPLEPEHPIPPTTVAEALNLLKLHAANVGRPGYVFGHHAPTRSMAELREGIQRKIDAIRRHRKSPPA
jgi:hypothetical protein